MLYNIYIISVATYWRISTICRNYEDIPKTSTEDIASKTMACVLCLAFTVDIVRIPVADG